MKIDLEDIDKLNDAITVLWNDRKDLETLEIRDVLHDIICYCKKNSFEERLKFAKKIINGEVTYNKRKHLTIKELENRRIFEKWWLIHAKENIPGYNDKCK